MVGTLWGVYMCQNYNIPDIRRFADSDLVLAKQIEETYPKPKSEDKDEIGKDMDHTVLFR
ncbi:hypothetical protein CFP56_034977 [Quercus suber]|uniref:Uncharacterized protein n=1 Tax=Quercus suber TaxID=58331 RepID=A0AAW0JBF2_QUESU